MALRVARDLKDSVERQFAPEADSTSTGFVTGLLTRVLLQGSSLAVANTATTTARVCLSEATPIRFRAQSFKIVPNAAVTAANTDVGTVTLLYNNGNGGSDTVVAQVNTATTAGGGSGNWTAGQPLTISINGTNAVVPSGSCVIVKVNGAGAGMACPAFEAFLRCDPE